MNWTHFTTVIWLRWRLTVNQVKRQGRVNAVIAAVFAVAAAVGSVVLFFAGLIGGILLLPSAPLSTVLLVWDVAVVGFLFFWFIGLLTEVQRSELLSLEKLLHLPISLRNTFLINYLSSFVSLSFVLFVPAMTGLSIAHLVTQGPMTLVVLPLLAGFLVMVTAVTYQFRGWMATLMVNKRRRRTIVVLLTMGFILVFQIPNFINMTFIKPGIDRAQEQRMSDLKELGEERAAGEITTQEYGQGLTRLQDDYQRRKKQNRDRQWQQFMRVAAIVHVSVPPGWLPYGVQKAMAGNVWPALAGTLGACLIAALSLRRAYHTTLRFYRGGYTAKKPERRRRPTPAGKPVLPEGNLLERRLPWIPDHASAWALATFRSLTRAPEAKMALLTPLIIFVVFGASIFGRRGMPATPPPEVHPLLSLAAIAMAMFGVLQMSQNQFGYDRTAFRALILMPCRRSSVLLGKNLALAPLGLGLGLLALIVLQFVFPLSPSHLLAALLQLVTAFLLFCLIGNFVSIVAPVRIAAGSMRPARPKASAILMQILFSMLFPVALIPLLFPIGIDALLHYLHWDHGIPVNLLLSAALLGGTVLLYRSLLIVQGRFLASREQKILETVTIDAQ